MSALFFFLSCLLSGALAANTTSVQVFYESLCSDSIAFFTNKLIPTYTQKDFNFYSITPTVEIIPFGKATKNETTGNYTCQHGPSECDGNRLHACAIKYIKDQQQLFNYIGCMMNATTPVNKTIPYPAPDKCKAQAGSAIDNITTCYNNNEGMTLFEMYGKNTTDFFGQNNYSVPFIAFNNKFNDAISKNAIENFRKTLCSQVGMADSNNYCSDVPKSAAASLSASFALVLALFFSFYAAL